jgi:hypothetical protein
MHVTIACFYGGFIFFSLSTSSFISIFPYPRFVEQELLIFYFHYNEYNMTIM